MKIFRWFVLVLVLMVLVGTAAFGAWLHVGPRMMMVVVRMATGTEAIALMQETSAFRMRGIGLDVPAHSNDAFFYAWTGLRGHVAFASFTLPIEEAESYFVREAAKYWEAAEPVAGSMSEEELINTGPRGMGILFRPRFWQWEANYWNLDSIERGLVFEEIEDAIHWFGCVDLESGRVYFATLSAD